MDAPWFGFLQVCEVLRPGSIQVRWRAPCGANKAGPRTLAMLETVTKGLKEELDPYFHLSVEQKAFICNVKTTDIISLHERQSVTDSRYLSLCHFA